MPEVGAGEVCQEVIGEGGAGEDGALGEAAWGGVKLFLVILIHLFIRLLIFFYKVLSFM